jgi:hypothetical protein
MKNIVKPLLFALVAACAVPAGAAAGDAAPPAQACAAPNLYQPGRINWFLGFDPSDHLLSAWCRIQALPGNVRFNVYWPVTNAHKSWDTSFGTPLPPQQIIKIVQSLIPEDDRRVASDSGVAFSDVLANAVQLEADRAPDGTPLGFAPTHPAARQVVLWEPLVLRVKPVVLAGQEFTLSVALKPNLGLLALALAGRTNDVTVKAWSERFQTGNLFGTSCSALFPECDKVPKVSLVHLPLLVDSVKLQATGDNMTSAAVIIGKQIYASNASLATDDPMKGFDVKNGSGKFELHDLDSTVTFEAVGRGGTKSITVTYKANAGKDTFRERIGKIGQEYRVGAVKKEAPSVPDSLGRL